MATPIRHRIELYTMRELHLELLLSPRELLNPLSKPSRLSGLEVVVGGGVFWGMIEVDKLVRIRLALLAALSVLLVPIPDFAALCLFLGVGAR